MPVKRKPKKSSNNLLPLMALLLFGFLCLCLIGGGATAYGMGLFEPPLPTLAPIPTKGVTISTKAPTISTKAAAINTPTRVNQSPTAPLVKPNTAVPTLAKAIVEKIAKADGAIEGLTLAQDKTGTLHVIYNVLNSDATHKLVHHQKPVGGAWSSGNTVAQGDVFTPLARLQPNTGHVCLFWTGRGMFKSCFVNNAWSTPEQITSDPFASSPTFAPDGAVHFLMSANDTMYKGVDLDLPNTNSLEKFLAVDSSGRVHIVSQQLNDKKEIIHLFSDDKGATWSKPAVITAGDELVALAADAQGRVHALFSKTYRFWRRDKGWSEPASLPITLEIGGTSFFVDSKDLGHILVGGNYLRQNADGAWAAPAEIPMENILTNAATSAQLWVEANGTRHFIWAMSDNTVMYRTQP